VSSFALSDKQRAEFGLHREARGIFGAIARVGMQAAKFAGKAATGGSFPSAKDNVNVARLPSIAMRELSYEFDELD
jgi:hypothetical protein